MRLEAFLDHIKMKQIPPEPPDGLSPGGHGFQRFDDFRSYWIARDECIKRGMWAIIDKAWTEQLANWIGSRKVLEIMAGAGWLARALNDYGISIIATDDHSWDGRQHTNLEWVYPVEKMPGLEAVAKIEADILLVSWPPYEDDAITACARQWGDSRSIVYIGEGDGGCNAPASFWEHFKVDESAPAFPMVSWDGIHDYVHTGYWREPQRAQLPLTARAGPGDKRLPQGDTKRLSHPAGEGVGWRFVIDTESKRV